MEESLFAFQKKAVKELRKRVANGLRSYRMDSEWNQVVSLQAPTGSGKTIIMTALIESILYGAEAGEYDLEMSGYEPQPDAVFVWLSDSPSLNAQSRDKIALKSGKIRWNQCVEIQEDSFDQEELSDGTIYFLNTQKLSKSSKLVQHGDRRTYTIWETLENTARDKSNRLYIIIDEAHRGTQGAEAGKATSIMQRFIKGFETEVHHMRPMPLIVGMSATAERFNRLVDSCDRSTLLPVLVKPEDVRSSGLLKERIKVVYTEDVGKYDTVAVLQAAVEEYVSKCEHWLNYTRVYHYENVCPIFVVQVEAGSGKKISGTDLDEMLATINEGLPVKLQENEVVHTFGSKGDIVINGMTVHHVEQEHIQDDKNIRVVLFKESLSTGWDCPRAETMMSYRTAQDPTYIAQLLGRMIRTPRGSRIDSDETLNEVQLFLPYFNKENVKKIVEALKSAEGDEIPAYIDEEAMGHRTRPLTVHTRGQQTNPRPPQQGSLWPQNPPAPPTPSTEPGTGENTTSSEERSEDDTHRPTDTVHPNPPSPAPSSSSGQENTPSGSSAPQRPADSTKNDDHGNPPDTHPETGTAPAASAPELNREEILEFINAQAFLTYKVHDTRVNNYLKSLHDLASLLTIQAVDREANNKVKHHIFEMIHTYADGLRTSGRYDELKNQVLQMKLSVLMYDPFGEEIKQADHMELFQSSRVVERQSEAASVKLGRSNYATAYAYHYQNELSDEDGKIDCILFVAEQACMDALYAYAKQEYHRMLDANRRKLALQDERCRKQYQSIVAQGDKVSKHSLRLPDIADPNSYPSSENGNVYYKHLYADEYTGTWKAKLNSWEEGVLAEEQKRDDFVCWVRNPSRRSWALCIHYVLKNVDKPMFPDFLVIRRDSDPEIKYVVDILEPHGSQYVDGLYKAKGMAEYAEDEARFGRIQMIREVKDLSTGRNRYLRLDFTKSEVREAIRDATTQDEFDHIFKTMGIYDD